MRGMLTTDDRRIAAFLAPLTDLEPVNRPPAARSFGRRHRSGLVAACAVLFAALAVGAGGSYSLLSSSGTATPTLVSPGQSLGCLGIAGMRADKVEALLTGKGYTISWRLIQYYDPSRHGGEAGYASSPSTVPADSIVEDAVQGTDGTVVVSVRSPTDPYAPTLDTTTPAACLSTGG
jgi:hypothetical protein